MEADQLKLLADIIDAIDAIDHHLQGRRVFAEYLDDRTRRRAVERELEIIGEAVSKLLRSDPDFPLSYARQIVDMRNRVIHAYDTVDNILVWKTIMKDVPVLRAEAQALLEK
jgi:uncharacterized protein with HEPN domain